MKNQVGYGVTEKPPLKELIPYSIQMLLSIFGSTVLVPILCGMSINHALLGGGLGTIIYLICTRMKVGCFLGSSFAFIPCLILAASYGPGYVAGGCILSGLMYMIVSAIISKTGSGWISKLLPPVVIGSVITVIGLSLSATAISSISTLNGEYSLVALSIATVSLGAMIIANNCFKGFISTIPVVIGMAAGYLFTLVMGWIFPAYHIIDFSAIREAAWFGFPIFVTPKFNITIALAFLITSFSTIVEHCGDTANLAKITGVDIFGKIGLHRTLFADGLSNAVSGLVGACPTTTYGESLSTMSISKVHSVWVLLGSAIMAIFLSFFPKFGALIATVPSCVINGLAVYLFGAIASSGMRTLVDAGVNYGDNKNLTISSVVLTIGIGGLILSFMVGNTQIQISAVALSTLIGILLNAVLPGNKD